MSTPEDTFFDMPRPECPTAPNVAVVSKYVADTLAWLAAGRDAVAASELAARQRAYENYRDSVEPMEADVFRRFRTQLDRVHQDLETYTARLSDRAQIERIERAIAVFPDRVSQAYTSPNALRAMEDSAAYQARWPAKVKRAR